MQEEKILYWIGQTNRYPAHIKELKNNFELLLIQDLNNAENILNNKKRDFANIIIHIPLPPGEINNNHPLYHGRNKTNIYCASARHLSKTITEQNLDTFLFYTYEETERPDTVCVGSQKHIKKFLAIDETSPQELYRKIQEKINIIN